MMSIGLHSRLIGQPARLNALREFIDYANNKGQGVVVVDGKMIENLHVESAWRLVELAEAIEKLHKGGH